MESDHEPIVVCPGCNVQMIITKVVATTGLEIEVHEYTYECPKCGTITKRRNKR